MARILQVLERHPLFEGMAHEDLNDLVVDCRLRTPCKGDRIFSAGEPADAFYIVASGEVKTSSAMPSGRECIVEVLRVGETFALVPVLDGEPHPVTATALTDCSLVRVPRAAFLRLLARRPELGARTGREVAQRMRRFRARLEEITTRTVPARVAAHLLHLAEVQAGYAGRGAVLDLGAPREVVAAAIGSVREVFVRTIRGFERQGLISIDARRVSLLDPERLQEVAEDRGRRAGQGSPRARAVLRERVFAAPRREIPVSVG